MSIHSYEDPSVLDVFRIVLRHRKKVMLFVALVVLCTTTIALILPPKYSSEAKLLLLVGRESVSLDPVVATGKTLSINASRDTEINTLLEIVKSRAVLSKVVDKLGAEEVLKSPEEKGIYDRGRQLLRDTKGSLVANLKHGIEAWTGQLHASEGDTNRSREEEAIDAVNDCLSVSSAKNSTVITVAAEARSPAVAQTLVAALVDVYTREHMKLHSTVGSEDFFRREKQSVGDQLASKRMILNALRSETGIGSVEAEYKRLEDEKANIESLRNTLARDLAGTKAKCESLKLAVTAAEEVILTERSEGNSNAATDGIRQQLYEIELAEGKASRTYTDDHPDLKRIRAQLEVLRERFAAEEADRTEFTYGRNPGREALQLECEQEQTRAAELAAQLQAADLQGEQVLASIRKPQ